jgi:hypothetical protein
MKLPGLEKKLRVGLHWALDEVFERDLGQYITLRDVESLSRLLETTRHNSSGAKLQSGNSARIA